MGEAARRRKGQRTESTENPGFLPFSGKIKRHLLA